MRVFYKPEDGWVGDAIPFWDGRYSVFFLADRREGGTYGERTSWDVVETDDLLHFVERGTAVTHGAEDAPDRNAYTGSVVKDATGRHHIFYTGHNPAISRDGMSMSLTPHKAYLLYAGGCITFEGRRTVSFVATCCCAGATKPCGRRTTQRRSVSW